MKHKNENVQNIDKTGCRIWNGNSAPDKNLGRENKSLRTTQEKDQLYKIQKESDGEDVVKHIKAMRLTWFGHIQRAHKTRAIASTMN